MRFIDSRRNSLAPPRRPAIMFPELASAEREKMSLSLLSGARKLRIAAKCAAILAIHRRQGSG